MQEPATSNVVAFTSRKQIAVNHATVRAARQLLAHAEAGLIRSLAWVADYHKKDQQPGATGEYAKDLEPAIRALQEAQSFMQNGN